MAARVVSFYSSNSEEDEESMEMVQEVPEGVRKQTELVLYEYIDFKSQNDSELTSQQASLMHRATSDCIKGKDETPNQGDMAIKIAHILRDYGDEFQAMLESDERLRSVADKAVIDTDTGQPSIKTIGSHISIVVENVLGVDINGIAQNINIGRIAAVFYYCYSLCKKFIKFVFANHTLIEFLCSVGGLLIASLAKVHFYDWLNEQGGWGRMVVSLLSSNTLSIPNWSNHALLFGAVTLLIIWGYRQYRGFN